MLAARGVTSRHPADLDELKPKKLCGHRGPDGRDHVGDGTLDRVHEAFRRANAPQCGFCMPGMVLLAKALLAEQADPDPARVEAWMSANICRCTGYQSLRRAFLALREQ